MRNNRLKPYLLVLVVALFTVLLTVQVASAASGGSGSISLTTLGSAYSQNFDALATSGTTNEITVINGWYIEESGTSGNNNGQYQGGTGTGNGGDTYSFGIAGTNALTDRALGGLRSGSLVPVIGASFTNNTGATITSLDISYTGEMWRAGITSRNAADRLDFQYSTDATSLASGTWTDVNSLDFSSPNISASAGALDGNATGNFTALSQTISSLSIANGTTFWIRWEDFDITSSDDGLAVDDFSITPNGDAPTGTLVINEVDYDQPSTDMAEFLELKNVSGSSINLDPYSVVLWNPSASSGAGASYLTIELPDVSLAAGDYYVICGDAANVANCDLDVTPDSNLIQNGEPDAIGLWLGAELIDAVSYEGDSQAPYTEGSGVGLVDTGVNADEGISRCPDGVDTNVNNVDFKVAPSTPGATNSCTVVDTPPTVSSTTPADNATNVAANTNISITFSEAVNLTGTIEVVGSASGTQNLTPAGGPTTFTLDPTDFTTGETVTVTVLATQVADQDGTADQMAANYAFDFTISGGTQCGQTFTPIYSIQGSGTSAAITGNVTTEGVVVSDNQTNAGLQGFYMQDPTGDGNPATSDGIFVFTGPTENTVNLGDRVRVTGYARERFNLTTINGANDNNAIVPAANIEYCGPGATITPIDVTMPFDTTTFVERYEGMLVRFPQTLVIAEYFNYDQFGEIVLALPLDGETRPFNPTSVDEPGAPAQARALANALRRITLDDGRGGSNPPFLRHPNGNQFTLSNSFRGGDEVTNTVGVLTYDFSLYRIIPTGPATYNAVNPRPAAPEAMTAELRVAAFNMLNFFITPDYAGGALDETCGPAQTMECRGHDADQPNEFTRQRDKLIQALIGIDADVVGLNEIENTTGVDVLGDPVDGIVAGLNAIQGNGTYDFIDTGTIGTDAIRVGIIYRPDSVTPVGDYELLTNSVDSRFASNNRPALAQTFEDSDGERFTVVVNHLKSKGCDEASGQNADQGDGQGCWNQTRENAAAAIVDWLATDPTNSGDPDFLIVGDLNSYAKEDPIDVLKLGSDDTDNTDDDYVNLIEQFQGPYAYSYTFDGQAGYLDHALANESMSSQVVGATQWHINSDESDVLDYDTTFKPAEQEALYEANAFRSSDHDPVIVGLNLGDSTPVDTTPPTTEIITGPLGPTTNPDASFTFTGNDDVDGTNVTFECSLDGASFAACTSPQGYTGLSVGNHTFQVRAKDSAGNVDLTPAQWDWEIKAEEPPADLAYLVTTTTAGSVDGTPFDKNDILLFDGEEWSVFFDGAANGLPAKADLTAIHVNGENDILMSFKQNKVSIPGFGPVFGHDILGINGDALYLYFDGSDVGLTTGPEKLDSIHVLPATAAPVEGCIDYLLVSTRGPGKVPAYGGGNIKFSGEDVLGFCATSTGDNTAGHWFMVLDGSTEGMKKNVTESISANEDGTLIYLTTKAAFNVDSAVGGHSMVYVFDTTTGEFSGPIFSAPAEGLNKKVDGLHVDVLLP